MLVASIEVVKTVVQGYGVRATGTKTNVARKGTSLSKVKCSVT